MQTKIETSFGTFQLKRLTLRTLKEVLLAIEELKTNKNPIRTIEIVEGALANTIESDVPLTDTLDVPQAMELIGAAISGGRVSDTERKKSELPH